jgi:hypothetical protein
MARQRLLIAFGHTTRPDPVAIGPTKYDDVWRRWLVAGRSTALARQCHGDIMRDPIAIGPTQYVTRGRMQVDGIRIISATRY